MVPSPARADVDSAPRVWSPGRRSVLVAAIVTQAISAPGQTVGVSVFVDHLIADLDITRSALATAYLIGTGAGALSMPFAGRLVDRRGLRWATMVFGGTFGVVLALMSGVVGFVTLAVGFAFTRMLGQGALTLTATTTVAVWFDRNRGAALGLLSAIGGGLMSMVPLAIAASIDQIGWRSTWIVLGGVVTLVAIPLGRWVVRDRPLLPGEDVHPDPVPTVEPAVDHLPHVESAVRVAIRSAPFWIVTGGVALAAALGTALVFHQIAILTDRGLTEIQAAANFIPQTAATAIAAISAGRLADRLPARWLFAGATASLGVAGLSVLAVNSPLAAAAYGAALGASGGAIRTIEGAVLPRWFGTAQIGELRGIVLGAGVAGSALGPLFLSLANDVSGAYDVGIVALAALAAVLSVAALVVLPRYR